MDSRRRLFPHKYSEHLIGRTLVAYSVPKLTDYSAAALEKAAGECIAACSSECGEVRTDADLKSFRDRWMARKNGILTQNNDLWLKGAPKEAKREAGQTVNEVKRTVEQFVGAVYVMSGGGRTVGSSPVGVETDERVDISLPGVRRPTGAA